jgi:hypothetical protein
MAPRPISKLNCSIKLLKDYAAAQGFLVAQELIATETKVVKLSSRIASTIAAQVDGAVRTPLSGASGK